MSFEINGRLAEKYETQKVSDRFQKREFVLEVKSNSATGYEFVDFIKFQSTQDKCSMLDDFNIDDTIKVSFNLRGRKWEKEGQVSYFTNLEAWRIEKLSDESNHSAPPGGCSAAVSAMRVSLNTTEKALMAMSSRGANATATARLMAIGKTKPSL